MIDKLYCAVLDTGESANSVKMITMDVEKIQRLGHHIQRIPSLVPIVPLDKGFRTQSSVPERFAFARNEVRFYVPTQERVGRFKQFSTNNNVEAGRHTRDGHHMTATAR